MESVREAPARPWQRLFLAPLQAVQVLSFRAGEGALLEAEQGCAWVTCDGRPEDHFLQAGQRLWCSGPARLRMSAVGQEPAHLVWAAQAVRPRGAPGVRVSVV
ncbi:DUF2917 domain-containing protein [Verminephrobacter aporrectodeae]|uniref:DUF2917 domain-containing protein n=1 Tax=Verminephrobacter aporrectodeae TaxID=1110389 RepID=UPI0002376BC9|nr:DUF2917 domain-containing protein [Verminephrobacter aporrectodeae]